jgi:hypothetical protein
VQDDSLRVVNCFSMGTIPHFLIFVIYVQILFCMYNIEIKNQKAWDELTIGIRGC